MGLAPWSEERAEGWLRTPECSGGAAGAGWAGRRFDDGEGYGVRHAVIMAGGSGTRLWPLSRAQRPKQLLDVLSDDGWLSTGDLGEIDDEGFVRVTGRKKELLVTVGGKNVAPTVLEDALRAHPLVSQCMVVGDGRPFIAALVTLDPDAVAGWARSRGKPRALPDLARQRKAQLVLLARSFARWWAAQ